MSRRHSPVYASFAMIGVAGVAAIFLTLPGIATGVAADERAPAGPAAEPTEVILYATDAEPWRQAIWMVRPGRRACGSSWAIGFGCHWC